MEKLTFRCIFTSSRIMIENYEDWARVVHTWESSLLPVKMHISSPREEKTQGHMRTLLM